MEQNILIHTCCADCLLNTLNCLQKDYSKFTVFFFNPNIHPRAEYNERLNSVKKILQERKDIKLIVPDYQPKLYFETIEGKEPRCKGCWEIRLRNTFEYAKKNSFTKVTSTLLSSCYQDTQTILSIALALEKEYGIDFVNLENCECLNNKGFYKQNYCGCCYSLVERMNEKYR